MSTDAAPAPTTAQPDSPETEKPAETTPVSTATTTTTTNTTTSTPAANKSMKKVKSKKDLKNDPARFETPGVNFNAKLIGIEEVESARGDKMCQESLHRLKIAVKTAGDHKQKIVVNVSLEGIKIIDRVTLATNHVHAVHKISFISRDVTDSRAFGYIYGVGDGTHKFFAIKTEKAAENLVLSLRDLFQVVFDLKKKEMEEAKKKQEEPVEKAEEVKEGESQEPVYQVPKNGAPVENIYQVPNNNGPVAPEEEKKEPKSNLLDLENELETLGQGIEQMNTMESLFSDLESPPTQASQSSTDPWGQPTTPARPPESNSPAMINLSGISIGGTMFPPAPPAGMPGAPGMAPGPLPGQFGFNQPGPGPAGPFAPQPGMGMANPFGAPNVPPRAGVAFGAPAPGGFPPTPFPGANVRPGFPSMPGAPPPGQPAGPDPFGASDPFAAGPTAFEEDVLTPARIEKPREDGQPEPPKPKDAFGDLCDIGSTTKVNKSPKDMFKDLSAPTKKSLNELKAEPIAPAKPVSPSAFQASDPFGSVDNSDFASGEFKSAFSPGSSSDPFDTSFVPASAKTASNAQNPAFSTAQVSISQTGLMPSKETKSDSKLFGEEDFNLPSPDVPPPPLPDMKAVSSVPPPQGPAPPPRPEATPPLPPRPKSAGNSSRSSVSSISSASESQSTPNTPPLPPRPGSSSTTTTSVSVPRPGSTSTTNVSVPRPRPRPHASVTSGVKDLGTSPKTESPPVTLRTNTRHTKSQVRSDSRKADRDSVSSKSDSSERVSVKSTVSTGSSVSDPFATTDPFASEDPFAFAPTDPFATDPFATDPFSDPSSSSQTSTSDPFTSATPSQPAVASSNGTSDDPFAMFDKAFSSEPFTFEKSGKNRVKLKVPVSQ